MIFNLIKLAASAALVAAVIWWADGAAVLAHLGALSLGWILLAILGLAGATAAMAWRWQLVAGHLGLRLSYRAAFQEYYLATLLNQTLPGGAAGDVTRAFRARHGVDLKTAALSVAVERLLGQIAIFGVLGLGMVSALLVPGGLAWGSLATVIPPSLMAIAAVGWWLSKKGGAVGRFICLVLTLQQRADLSANAVISSGCVLFSFYACARATGTVIPPEGWATLIPLVLIAMLVPLSIGGWGWREGAAAALFPLINAPASAGVAASLAYGSAILIAALPAALLLLTRGTAHPISSPTQKG
ncbi:MAG: lysylphosphatidylglycerol synthase transmembrane domain-containing protein [Pseudomonadota bacterium]